MYFSTPDCRISPHIRVLCIGFSVVVCITAFSSVTALSQTQPGSGSTPDKPSVSLVFVVDSALLDKDFASARTVLTTFLRSLRDDDEYAIYVSDEHTVLMQDFSGDPDLADAALHSTVGTRRNALYDTVVTAAQFLDSDGSNDRKVLFVLSSGVDTGSKSRLSDAISAVKKFAVQTVVISIS